MEEEFEGWHFTQEALLVAQAFVCEQVEERKLTSMKSSLCVRHLFVLAVIFHLILMTTLKGK